MFVYLIRQADSDYIKIGVASAPRDRLDVLQIGNPLPLVLEWQVECADRADALAVEAALHELYSKTRLTGEWFLLPEAKFIADMRAIMILGEHRFQRVAFTIETADTESQSVTLVAALAIFESDPSLMEMSGKTLCSRYGGAESTWSKARKAFRNKHSSPSIDSTPGDTQ